MNEVLNAVYTRQIESVAQHLALSQLFDFFGLQGFKRLHDYRAKAEQRRSVKFSKWIINNTDMLPKSAAVDQDVIPLEFFNKTASAITPEEVKKITVSGFSYYETKLNEEITLYSQAAKDLEASGQMAAAIMVEREIEYVTCERKKCRRIIREMRNCDYSLNVIVLMQERLHGFYKKRV